MGNFVKVFLFFIVAAALFVTPAAAQDWEWDKTFGGSEEEQAVEVQITADGGFIIIGLTQSFGAGSGDVWLIKTDGSGNEEWSRTFGGAENDTGFSVRQTSDGGYIITGFTESYGAGWRDVWLIKTDANGNMEWEKTFGGANNDLSRGVQQTTDGGYIIAGDTESYGAGSRDAWLIKTDASGNKQWERIMGGANLDAVRSIQQTDDGGYVVAGYTESYGAGSLDAWLIKIPPLQSCPKASAIDTGLLDIVCHNV